MENPVLSAPEITAYCGLEFHKDRLRISAGGMEVAGLYTAVGANPQKENFFQLSLNASYQLTDWLGIWARGDNLLNQQYEILAGYPMPGINFMAGLSLSL
jgi:iron complex outermembrane receptor protein